MAYYLRRADHVGKIRDGKQRTDIEKYSCVNRTIKNESTTCRSVRDFPL